MPVKEWAGNSKGVAWLREPTGAVAKASVHRVEGALVGSSRTEKELKAKFN